MNPPKLVKRHPEPSFDHPWYLIRGYGQRLSATLGLRQGRVEQAHAGFGRLRRQGEGWGVVDPAHIPWAADGITAALACGHDHDAGRIVERLERAAPLSSRWPKAAAATGGAALAERAGDLGAAEASYRRALAILDGSPLRLARAGCTNQQIAHQLHLSINTVETHLSNVYRKLGIHRRWELIARNALPPNT